MFLNIDKKKIILFKKYETFHQFPPEFVKKHILFGIFRNTPFLCKISLLTRSPSFRDFSSSNTPYFENWGRTPASIL